MSARKIKIIDRRGNITETADKKQEFIAKVYSSPALKSCVKILASPAVNKLREKLHETELSAKFIDRFADKNGIDLFDYENREYKSFGEFFTRRVKPGRRLIDRDEDALVSPADGKVTAYEIANSDIFVIKNSVYSTAELLHDKKLAERFSGGYAIVIRLAEDDNYRYIYPCDGIKSHDRRISGNFYPLLPAMNEFEPVFTKNNRSYSMIRSTRFGDIVMAEYGSPNNTETETSTVKKGEEKGFFRVGSSAIILLLEKGKAVPCEDILQATKQGMEFKVGLGEKIAAIE